MRLRRPFLFAPIALAACFSQSSGGSGAGPEFDASTDAGFDSSMPETEAPESGVDAAMDAPPETAPMEASVDASVDVPLDTPVEAAPSPITVVVGGALGFEKGVPVVFSDATGAVVSSTTTSAAGTALTLAPNVTMVTVLLGTFVNPAPYTAMGLKPGDTVVVADTASIPALSPVAALTAVPSTAAFEAGVTNYNLRSGSCASGSPTLPVYMNLNSFSTQPCVGLRAAGASFVAAFPALVEAVDATGLLGFAFAKNSGITTPDDAGYSEVMLGSTWSTGTTSQTVTLNNTFEAGSFPTTTYSEVADGVVTPVPQQMTGNYLTHVGYADAVQVETELQSSVTLGFGGAALVTTAAPPAADGNVTFDLSALDAEPEINGMSVDSTTVARPKVAWTVVSGDLSKMTGLVMHLSYGGTTPDGGSQSGLWTIVSPGTAASSVQVPALPASLAGFAPTAMAFQPWVYDLYAVDGQTAVPSYSAMLPITSVFVQQQCYVRSPIAPALPGTGHAAIMVYGPGSGC